MKVKDYQRIESLIRAARVQRSAAIGTALGELLGEAWLRAESFAGSMGDYLSGRPEIAPVPAEPPR